MKKRVFTFFIFSFIVCGIVFAHTRQQVIQFVNDYVSASNDTCTAVDLLIKNPDRNADEALKRFYRAQEKLNKVQALLPYYVDELTDSDVQKVQTASEKMAVAGAKLQTWQQQNGYY